jgi:hypothetical protein
MVRRLLSMTALGLDRLMRERDEPASGTGEQGKPMEFDPQVWLDSVGVIADLTEEPAVSIGSLSGGGL